VLDSFGLFYGDFCMDLYSVDSDEAMQWCVKHFIALIVKKRFTLHCFIATIFYSALNASLMLIFMEKYRLTLNRCYFSKEIRRLTLYRRYFLK
jgi:hypothetical protein